MLTAPIMAANSIAGYCRADSRLDSHVLHGCAIAGDGHGVEVLICTGAVNAVEASGIGVAGGGRLPQPGFCW